MKTLPTGTVTFLFTDIEGSTVLLQRLGDRRYAEVLAEHHRLLRAVFAEGSGEEIGTQGDAFLVAFHRARDAVRTAVAAQQALLKHSWPDGASLRVRMGLHTGEPVGTRDDYVGLDVHRAARICAAGHAGQILLSDAVSGLIARDLPAGVSLRDLGDQRLKDLREPEHLFQVVHPDLPTDFPPLKSLNVRPNNLPRQLASFVGRDREMTEVKHLLSIESLVTLTGLGGAGKTRLAVQVGMALLDHYTDGVWLVELAPLSDPSLVPKALASALGVPEQPGRSLTETLVDALRLKSTLVILDNCEHLVAACAHLVDALRQCCPNLRILATSREALGVTGETTWQVPSLSIPDPERLPHLDRYKEYEAVQLFVSRAVVSAPQFALTSNNATAVAQVCHRLDGNPLAIELAAARVKVLTAEQIAARLDERFRLLTSGSRTAPPRHQTLRAAMDWSFDLLSEKERTLLRRLSVFAGGWVLEATEAICSGKGVEAPDILDLLTHLVDKSLVVAQTQSGEARYRLLETVRQYALDKLLAAGEAADVRKRHRDWYVRLAETAPQLIGPQEHMWIERLEFEHDNLRAALAWSKADKAGAEPELRLAGALHFFWFASGHWVEGRRWLEDSLTRSSQARPSARLKTLLGATHLAWRQGDNERAAALGERGLALSREVGDERSTAEFLSQLGLVAIRQGDTRRAQTLVEEGLESARRLGDKFLIGRLLTDLGICAVIVQNYDRATALFEESDKESGPARHVSALRGHGLIALRLGNYRRANELFRESLALSSRVEKGYHFIWMVEECLEGLAAVASGEKNFVRGARLFAAADALRESLGRVRLPPFQADHDQRVAATRDAMGTTAFASAWSEGLAMTTEQAIEYALVH